jgi:hypothetical protein
MRAAGKKGEGRRRGLRNLIRRARVRTAVSWIERQRKMNGRVPVVPQLCRAPLCALSSSPLSSPAHVLTVPSGPVLPPPTVPGPLLRCACA